MTVIALPIIIVAGLLGMNVGGIPLAQDPHGFYIIVGIVVSFTLQAGSRSGGENDRSEPGP